MACRQCGGENQHEFGAEMNIHKPGLRGLDESAILLFARVVACGRCGLVEFTLPESELSQLFSVADEVDPMLQRA